MTTEWDNLTKPPSVGPMSQLPPNAQAWPATNTPVQPGEVQAAPIPLNVLNRLRDAGLTQDRDGLLLLWQKVKEQIAVAVADEMELRKLSVSTLIPKPVEGTNNVPLGNGFVAKAVVKFNYSLKAPEGVADTVTAVDNTIDAFRRISNEGVFIADRLFKWTVDISLTEYRLLVEKAKTDATAAKLLAELNKVLEIKPAAPTLEIKEPKVKK